MLRNLTKVWRYLCFQRHRHTYINVYLNITVKVSFPWKRIHQTGLVIETMIQKNLKGLERMEIWLHPIWRFILVMNIIAVHILLEMQM